MAVYLTHFRHAVVSRLTAQTGVVGFGNAKLFWERTGNAKMVTVCEAVTGGHHLNASVPDQGQTPRYHVATAAKLAQVDSFVSLGQSFKCFELHSGQERVPWASPPMQLLCRAFVSRSTSACWCCFCIWGALQAIYCLASGRLQGTMHITLWWTADQSRRSATSPQAAHPCNCHVLLWLLGHADNL
jgi:hypothetical protein